jgi:hypothetical protein
MYSIVILTLVSSWSLATVKVGKVNCPQKFEGKVEQVIDELGPSRALSTQRVIFKNLNTLAGQVGDQVQLDILKYGPVKIESGKDYQVQLKNGRLCWIEKL